MAELIQAVGHFGHAAQRGSAVAAARPADVHRVRRDLQRVEVEVRALVPEEAAGPGLAQDGERLVKPRATLVERDASASNSPEPAGASAEQKAPA